MGLSSVITVILVSKSELKLSNKEVNYNLVRIELCYISAFYLCLSDSSFFTFCLRTSKGLSIGEFDNTNLYNIFDVIFIDNVSIFIQLFCFISVLRWYFLCFRYLY